MTKDIPALHVDQSPLAAMFQGLMDVIRDPSISPEKMSAMLDVQERMIDRQALIDFNRARMNALSEMPVIDQNGSIRNKSGQIQSRYARYEDIDRVVRHICAKYGLVYSFNLTDGERGAVRVTCELAHIGGHVEHYGPFAVPLDTSGAKNPTQGVGSSASYGKRYTLCAALNIVTMFEDNDGHTATALPVGQELPDWSGDLLSDAQKAAAGGTGSYRAFFSALSPTRRGWLVENGHHDDLKAAAAEHGE